MKNTIIIMLGVMIIIITINHEIKIKNYNENMTDATNIIQNLRLQVDNSHLLIQDYQNTIKTMSQGKIKSLGTFRITYYCAERYPHICNDGEFDNTATGTTPTIGMTIGVDPKIIPFGTVVHIDGVNYVAEDTGEAVNGKVIDILVNTHQEALNLGVQYKEVFIFQK